jgi:hypothetical protein
MRLRSSPLVIGALAIATTGSLALTSTTAFASSHHGSHNKTSIHGNCNVVGNNNNVHCTTISHSHRHHGGGGEREFGGDFHHDGILEGVGDIVGGLLGAL